MHRARAAQWPHWRWTPPGWGGGLSEVFADGIERNIGRFAQLLAEGRGEEGRSEGSSSKGGADYLATQDRARAMQFLATMVGGLVLARATAAARPVLSDELLATLQAQLVTLVGDGAR